MTRAKIGRVGVTLDVRDRDDALADAAELEKLGYSTIWLPGGQLRTLDPLTDVIGATKSISVGSAIISADVFGPAQVAATFAEAESTNPGRFIVGIGGAQGAKPLRVLNSYLDELDSANPPVPVSARVLAALGPRKLELARDRASGAIPLVVTPEYTANARAVLGDTAMLVVQQFVVLEQDRDVAREAARVPLRFLSGINGYRQNFRRMGFTDSEVADLGDRLVDEVVACGGADIIAARVAEHLEAGADQVAISVLPSATTPVTLASWSALADKLIH